MLQLRRTRLRDVSGLALCSAPVRARRGRLPLGGARDARWPVSAQFAWLIVCWSGGRSTPRGTTLAPRSRRPQCTRGACPRAWSCRSRGACAPAPGLLAALPLACTALPRKRPPFRPSSIAPKSSTRLSPRSSSLWAGVASKHLLGERMQPAPICMCTRTLPLATRASTRRASSASSRWLRRTPSLRR